jgi:hypothetical protein
MEVIASGLGLTIFQLFDYVRLRETADLSGSKSAAEQEPPAP